MNIDIDKALNKPQVKELNDFLTRSPHKNQMNYNQINGFLTAIISAPSLIMPSMYNPVIFGHNPTFISEQEAAKVLCLTATLRNSISIELNKKIFNLLLWEKERLVAYQDASLETIAQWCEGYCQGTQLDHTWMENNEAVSLLLPFSILANHFDLSAENYNHLLNDNTAHHKEQYRSQIPNFIKKIYKLWEEPRKLSRPIFGSNEMLLWLEPKITPNSLCFCGSNKKLIDCCKLKPFH